MSLVTVRKVKNGSGSKVARHDIDPELREAYLGYALYAHQRSQKMSTEERVEAMRKVATYRIFPATHIAQLFGVHRSFLTRHGVKVETGQKRAGGTFNPSALHDLIHALREKNENETYGVQHIIRAYESGCSITVIARLIGVSTSYVSNMMKEARNTSAGHPVERTVAAADEGRSAPRGALGLAPDAEYAKTYNLVGVWDTDPATWPAGHLPNPDGEDGFPVEFGDMALGADHPNAFTRADADKSGHSHIVAGLAWPCTRDDFGHEGCAANGKPQGVQQPVGGVGVAEHAAH